MISFMIIALFFLVFTKGVKRLIRVFTAKMVQSKKAVRCGRNDFLSAFTIASRPSLMDRWEIDLYQRLTDSLKPAYVFPQVAMSAFLKTSDAKGKGRAVFSQKYVDFLVCAPKSFKPLYVIELDGASHRSAVAKMRDAARDQMLRNAGITVQRYQSAIISADILKSDFRRHSSSHTPVVLEDA